MKKLHSISLLASVFLTTSSLIAQKDSSGIYKSSSDFQQRKLSYAINCKVEKHKINSNVLFDGSEIKVKHRGNNYTLKKNEAFGYRACDGTEYRFAGDKQYKILNPTEPLMIYFYHHPAHSPKNTAQYPPLYFFSKDAASPLQELTKANLKAAFPGNHTFHDNLDAQFKGDIELYSYDTFHKMFKLNWILQNSTINN